MFLVLTAPKYGVSDNVDVVAPRLITDDPSKALIEARKTRSDAFLDCIRAVEIFELEIETPYDLHDIGGRQGPILVYRALHLGNNKWQEGFYGSWKTIKQFSTTLAHIG